MATQVLRIQTHRYSLRLHVVVKLYNQRKWHIIWLIHIKAGLNQLKFLGIGNCFIMFIFRCNGKNNIIDIT